MTARLRSIAVVGALAGSAVACSSGTTHPPLIGSNGGSAGTAGAGGLGIGGAFGGSSGASRGGTAGSAGVSSTAGASGAGGAPAVCGNGVAEGAEPCDGTDLRGQDCAAVGFETGTLACTDCVLDLSGCSGTERCSNGRDDDGDGLVDCADPDCAGACAQTCAAPVELSDPGAAHGLTSGHAADVQPSCLPSGIGAGPAVAYQFTAATTGVVDATLVSTKADLSLSARTTCASAGSEVGCSEREAGPGAAERLRMPVRAGDVLFFVVAGTGSSEAGVFDLNVASRPIVCGDGNRDPGEECDDGNVVSGDGCSATCTLESDEHEPNDSVDRATPYTAYPFFASIADVTDVDYFSIVVPNANTTLYAETFDLGDGACVKHFMDTWVDVLDTDGTRVLGSDDDSGPGYCSSVRVDGIGPGTYFVRVRGTAGMGDFPYALNIGLAP